MLDEIINFTFGEKKKFTKVAPWRFGVTLKYHYSMLNANVRLPIKCCSKLCRALLSTRLLTKWTILEKFEKFKTCIIIHYCHLHRENWWFTNPWHVLRLFHMFFVNCHVKTINMWLYIIHINHIYNKILDRDWFSAHLFVT